MINTTRWDTSFLPKDIEAHKPNGLLAKGRLTEVGTATVYNEITENEEVVIKNCRRDIPNVGESLDSLRREYNIVFDISEESDEEDKCFVAPSRDYSLGNPGGVPFVCYKYVPGDTFSNYFKKKRSEVEILKCLRELLRALDILHRTHNIVHFDITPSNIIMSGNQPVIIDFGEARNKFDIKRLKKPPGVKEGFRPPEYFNATSLSPNYDVWQLGKSFENSIPNISKFKKVNEKINKMLRRIPSARPNPPELIKEIDKDIEILERTFVFNNGWFFSGVAAMLLFSLLAFQNLYKTPQEIEKVSIKKYEKMKEDKKRKKITRKLKKKKQIIPKIRLQQKKVKPPPKEDPLVAETDAYIDTQMHIPYFEDNKNVEITKKVNNIFNYKLRDVSGCYVDTGYYTNGMLSFSLSIFPNGRVKSIRPTSEFKYDIIPLVDCIKQKLFSQYFPEKSETYEVAVNYINR